MSVSGNQTPLTSSARTTRALAVAVAAVCLFAGLGGCESVEGRVRSAATSGLAVSATAAAPVATPYTAASADQSATPELSEESAPRTPASAGPPANPAQPSFDTAAYLGKPIESVHTNRREVALTFDDGPSANTEKVLAVLKANKAKATFFFVGKRAEGQQRYVQDAIAQGNEIGNHTWSHAKLRHMGPGTLGYEIDRAQSVLALQIGSAPLFVRPRSGKIDAKAEKAIGSRGLILVLWSIHPSDVAPSPSPKAIVRGATRGVRPGSIVLMHETNHNTVVALPKILAELRRRGLRPVTLSQLMAHGTP